MGPSTLRFVIIEGDDFIAADMAAGLRRANERAVIEHLRHNSAAADLDNPPGCLTVFITGDPLAEIDSSGLTEVADRMGAEIVVREGLDSNAAVCARGFYSLRAPFTDAALLSVTEALRDRLAA